MALKSFEELEQAASGDLFLGPAVKPKAEPVAAPRTSAAQAAEGAGFFSNITNTAGWSASYRQDNTIGSLVSRKDAGLENYDDGEFDWREYTKTHKLAGHEENFVGVLNTRRADAIRSQIEMEDRDKQFLDAAGAAGTLMQIAAGITDVPTLIPGSIAVRGARGLWSVGRSVLMGGVSAGATQAATEGLLQATQQTRSGTESVVNIGAAAVIGSLLGGSIATLLSKNERIAAEKAIGEISDITSGVKPNLPVNPLGERGASAGGAEVADGAFYVSPINRAKTREDFAVEGKVASWMVEKTAFFNPVLRSTQRFAASARQLGDTLYENTIYRVMHSHGETTGPSVEAAMRTRVHAMQGQAGAEAEAAYKEMRASGGPRMSKDDFYNEIGRAMRNNDESENQFVARAAQVYRKGFDFFTDTALKLGLLEEKDLDVKTASSYLSRFYNRDALLATEPQFLDVIGGHMAERMRAAHPEALAEVERARAAHKLELADISTSGPARTAKIDEIEAAGKTLDEKFGHLGGLPDALSEARGAIRSTAGEDRVAAQARVKELKAKGGADLAAYETEQANLRRRMRNLRERNPDAQAARAERIGAAIDEMHDTTTRSLAAYGKTAKNLLNKIADDPVGAAESAIAATERETAKAQALVERTQTRLTKIAEREGSIEQAQPMLNRLKAQEQRLADLTEKLAARDAGPDVARSALADIERILQQVTEDKAALSIRRGEAVARLKERAASVSPEARAERLKVQEARLNAALDKVEGRYMNTWGKRAALDLETGATEEFSAAGRLAAADVYGTLTGKTQQKEDVPAFLTRVSTGPLKDRTFMVPDELLVQNGWLHSDVRQIFNRYSRSVAGENELTRRFGRADMRDQLDAMTKEYAALRQEAAKATTIEDLNKVLGRDAYGKRKDLAAAKLDAQKRLSNDEASAMKDTMAGRDMLRGTYNQKDNNGNFAVVTRSLMSLNYVRQMGGVLLANISDFLRPAMVHGIGPYMHALPASMAQGIGKGSESTKLLVKEANLSGLIYERVTHATMSALGDVGDPFIGKMTAIERFLQKGTAVASKWNGINLFTDAQQTISSIVSQHRILEAVLGNGGKDGSFVAGNGERLLLRLGIDTRAQQDIAQLFATHGQTVDGIRVANTEKWLQAANASGVTKEIERAENAVWAYRTALNTDVNSIVSRKGLGDAPLMANTNIGRLMAQFSGYTMGAHSRVMIRGLQEDSTRLVGGLVSMTALGTMTAYLSSLRTGRESHEKRMADWVKNPAIALGEGLDRSGFPALLIDLSNRIERVSGGIGRDYKVNPIKSTIALAGGGHGAVGVNSTRASDSAGPIGAIFGPTAGMLDSALAAGRVVADKSTGKPPPPRDVNLSLALIPFQSYAGVREIGQHLTGNSVFTRP